MTPTIWMYVQHLNLYLADKIKCSSTSDTIIVKALAAMNNKSSEPWLPCTSKDNWTFANGSLYFKHQLYIPEEAQHQLVTDVHKSPARDTVNSSEPFIYSKRTIGGKACLCF